jgi:uncharacterized protein YecE (DUF72 family)
VVEDDASHPMIADVTTDFVYARLRRSVAQEPTGYSRTLLERWARHARDWASGGDTDLSLVAPKSDRHGALDVFIFFINGAKERAPAAARALLEEIHR